MLHIVESWDVMSSLQPLSVSTIHKWAEFWLTHLNVADSTDSFMFNYYAVGWQSKINIIVYKIAYSLLKDATPENKSFCIANIRWFWHAHYLGIIFDSTLLDHTLSWYSRSDHFVQVTEVNQTCLNRCSLTWWFQLTLFWLPLGNWRLHHCHCQVVLDIATKSNSIFLASVLLKLAYLAMKCILQLTYTVNIARKLT